MFDEDKNLTIKCIDNKVLNLFTNYFYPRDLSTNNLAYLNSEQALADIAEFITNIRKCIYTHRNVYCFPESAELITFGGSYAGSLSAWMRLKYPHLVHAAVSSSGPLLAKVDFYGKRLQT